MRTHIVFRSSTRATLRQAFKAHQITEQIVAMEDDLMSGPLGNVLLDDVQTLRLHWWEQILTEEDKTEAIPYLRDSFQTFSQWANALSDNDSLLFWVEESATEHTGFMCLLAYLPKSISVAVIMVSPASYKSRDREIRPRSAAEIMLSLIGNAKVISSRMRNRYETNWYRLLDDNGTLRIRRNRQVETVPEDYFDQQIIERAKKISNERFHCKYDGFFYAVRLIGDIIGRQKQPVMDVLIHWRIRCLIQKGLFSYQGSLTSMRAYMIKPKVDE